MSSNDIDISELLDSASNGDRDAANELFQIVYLELKHLANSQMVGEPLSNLLQPTAWSMRSGCVCWETIRISIGTIANIFLRLLPKGCDEYLSTRLARGKR